MGKLDEIREIIRDTDKRVWTDEQLKTYLNRHKQREPVQQIHAVAMDCCLELATNPTRATLWNDREWGYGEKAYTVTNFMELASYHREYANS